MYLYNDMLKKRKGFLRHMRTVIRRKAKDLKLRVTILIMKQNVVVGHVSITWIICNVILLGTERFLIIMIRLKTKDLKTHGNYL